MYRSVIFFLGALFFSLGFAASDSTNISFNVLFYTGDVREWNGSHQYIMQDSVAFSDFCATVSNSSSNITTPNFSQEDVIAIAYQKYPWGYHIRADIQGVQRITRTGDTAFIDIEYSIDTIPEGMNLTAANWCQVILVSRQVANYVLRLSEVTATRTISITNGVSQHCVRNATLRNYNLLGRELKNVGRLLQNGISVNNEHGTIFMSPVKIKTE